MNEEKQDLGAWVLEEFRKMGLTTREAIAEGLRIVRDVLSHMQRREQETDRER